LSNRKKGLYNLHCQGPTDDDHDNQQPLLASSSLSFRKQQTKIMSLTNQSTQLTLLENENSRSVHVNIDFDDTTTMTASTTTNSSSSNSISSSSRNMPLSVIQPVIVTYRSIGIGIFGATMRYIGMPLEKVALYMNSSQVTVHSSTSKSVYC
jgi:hypothetical protein